MAPTPSPASSSGAIKLARRTGVVRGGTGVRLGGYAIWPRHGAFVGGGYSRPDAGTAAATAMGGPRVARWGRGSEFVASLVRKRVEVWDGVVG